MVTTECRRCQYFIRRVDVHEILFRMHGKVIQTCNDRVITLDMDGVVNDSTWVTDELPTDHELIFDVITKRITHAAVPTRTPYARSDRA